MANTLLTPTKVLMESLRILHQKCNFIGTINRDYDEKFAVKGAKSGSTLTIRKPNQYTVRTGRPINVQETTEQSVVLTVATQKGVDMYFTSEDLTMSIDRFSERYIKPAMSVLAANLESTMIASVYKDVYQQSDNAGSAQTYAKLLEGRRRLTNALAPESDRVANMHPQASADLISAFSTFFNKQSEIGKQFNDGAIGHAAGFDFYDNTHWPIHTTGTTTNTMDVAANQSGATITVTNGSSETLVAGDIITLQGCNRVHPETKADTGELMQFVVTTGITTGGTTIGISPSIITSGATQNVSAVPTTAGAVTKLGGAASSVHDVSMLYHPDAFTFATADLEMPGGVDFSARQSLDGISMRIVRAYDINDDTFPCRLDVLSGFLTTRPELAVRLANN